MIRFIIELLQRVVAVTPHEFKFRHSGVGSVLESSVQQVPHFDGFTAAAAFEALASYAANLIVQPWRREYRTIKVSCSCGGENTELLRYCAAVAERIQDY